MRKQKTRYTLCVHTPYLFFMSISPTEGIFMVDFQFFINIKITLHKTVTGLSKTFVR